MRTKDKNGLWDMWFNSKHSAFGAVESHKRCPQVVGLNRVLKDVRRPHHVPFISSTKDLYFEYKKLDTVQKMCYDEGREREKIMILIATLSESWHNSSLGYVYRVTEEKCEVMDSYTGEWFATRITRKQITEAVKEGVLRKIS